MAASVMLARRIKDAVIPATTGTMSLHPSGTSGDSITLTSSATDGALGAAFHEVVAVDTITSEYRITSVVVHGFVRAGRHDIYVYTGLASAEVLQGSFTVAAGATADGFVVPVSMSNFPANTRVIMKVAHQDADGGTKACTVAINYVTV